MSALNMWHLYQAARQRGKEQWYPPARLAELRVRRLRQLGQIAAQAAHYREAFRRAGLDPNHLTEDALNRLPVLEKATLRSSGAEMLTEPASGLFPVNTSGSTGIPLQLLRNQRDQAEVSALWARLFTAYGRRTFDRQVNVGSGRAVAKKGPVVRLRQLGILPQLHQLASFDPPDRQIATLRRVKPHMISLRRGSGVAGRGGTRGRDSQHPPPERVDERHRADSPLPHPGQSGLRCGAARRLCG